MWVGGQRQAPAALPPGKTWYPLCRRLDWHQGQCGRVQKISPPLRFDPQPVESCYTDCVIPAHRIIIDNYKIYYPCLYISILRQILCGLGLDTAFPLCVNTMMSGTFPAHSAAVTD
jgi:hypothetical protein